MLELSKMHDCASTFNKLIQMIAKVLVCG